MLYFYGPGSMNCMATRGFPTTGDSAFPGEQNINGQLATFIKEGGTVYCCRFGLSLHGLREEDLIEGVIPATRSTCRTRSSTTPARAPSSTPPTWSDVDADRCSTLDPAPTSPSEGCARGRPGPQRTGRRPGRPERRRPPLLGGLGAALPVAQDSPYPIAGGRLLFDGAGRRRCRGRRRSTGPRFYDLTTADGVAYEQLARLHGETCSATTVMQTCTRYGREDTRCRFCAIEASLAAGATTAVKTPRAARRGRQRRGAARRHQADGA